MQADTPLSASPVAEKATAASPLTPEQLKRAVDEWKRAAGAAFFYSRDAITVVDLDGNIRAWNPSAERLYGWKEAEVAGKGFVELVRAVLPRPLAQIENILRREGIWEYELQETTRSGAQITVASRWTVWKNSSGAAIGRVHIDTDLTRVKRAEQQLRVVSGHLLNLRDEERRKLGRDLHDSAGQLLSMAKLNLSLAEEHLGQVNPRAGSYLEESSKLIDQALSEVRTISYLLHPPLLEELGLAGVLPWYIAGFSERSRIKVTLDVPQELGRLPRELELGLFRIMQECLTNVHRHSNSSTAQISLSIGNSQVRLKVEDQGQGMTANAKESGTRGRTAGVGLSGIRERVTNLGGQMQIRSGDWGTAVEVVFPMAESAFEAG
ncbi:MAG TPA: PAS domain-containing sensor histidine kinase [Candidatus Acidoferrales bacterium]|jgi:PAS domain S-box-containing protein|nr:PAS domain-containing sensor histidine kinase [Candidatus Acidoferrales bacterium]